ncbi:hypothetical protein ACMGDM_16290 [Sphingomonas sp. DT-51]|uniref:hypothetical protein n=1 Tax=Sphingomonas sp. DT-51 TaxID=3396165 RepID=UPI003F1C0BCB
MTNILIAGTLIALVVAIWNAVAAWRHASQPHDWRVDRSGLPQPANGGQLLILGVAASISMIVLLLTQATAKAVLAVLFGWSIAFAVLAVRNRRRSQAWFNGRDGFGR